MPSATAWAASATSTPGAAVARVVATDAARLARRAIAAAARRMPSTVRSSGSPMPTRTAAFALRRPAVGTARVSPGFPSKPASARKVPRPPSSAASIASAPGPRAPPLPTGTARSSVPTRSAGVVTTVNVRATMCSGGVRGWCRRDSWSGVLGADGPEGPFLPPGERIEEVGEAVEVGDDLAAVEPTLVGGGDRPTLGPPRDGAGHVERGGHPVLSGEHEFGRRLVARGHVVDHRLQRVDHRPRRERHAGLQLRAVRRRGGQLGTDHEQLALETDEQVVELRATLGV